MNTLRPYPEYKPSDIEWLGEVPAHWGVRRAKTILADTNDRAGAYDLELLSLSKTRGIIPQRLLSERLASASEFSQYRRVEPGQLVMNRMQAWNGVFGSSSYTGMISPDYAVFNITSKTAVLGFLMRTFQDPLWIQQFAALSKGVGTGFNRLYSEDLGTVPALVPPIDEQCAIADFLDVADARISRYIAAKRRMIALLEEQKQAIINQAVTRGLDPDVPLKPSGVDWLGDIPAHWDVMALRLRYSVVLGKMLDAKQITGAYLVSCLRNADVQWGKINQECLPTMDIRPDELSRYTVNQGDLLVCEGGEVGRAAVWKGVSGSVGFQKVLHRLRPIHESRDSIEFLFYVFRMVAKLGVFAARGNENTFMHLTGEMLRAYRFGFPPMLEQKAIAKFIGEKSDRIDSAIRRTHREIGLIQEYRTRLISDVVTGKLDMRGVELPAFGGTSLVDAAIGEDDVLIDIDGREAENR